eukprot:m.100834 g.100834  ORF g.100834 m.100834 type:complete len:846 (+) comp13726_c0_seq1:278-2815(+)
MEDTLVFLFEPKRIEQSVEDCIAALGENERYFRGQIFDGDAKRGQIEEASRDGSDESEHEVSCFPRLFTENTGNLRLLAKRFQECVDVVESMKPSTTTLIERAKTFDFSEQSRGNGWWALVEVLHRCIEEISRIARRCQEERSTFMFDAQGVCENLQLWSRDLLATSLGEVLALMDAVHPGFRKDSMFLDDVTSASIMDRLNTFDSSVFFGSCLGFHFPPGVRNIMTGIATVMAAYFAGQKASEKSGSVARLLNQALAAGRVLLDDNERIKKLQEAQGGAKGCDPLFLQAFWFLSEHFVVSAISDSVLSDAVAVWNEVVVPVKSVQLDGRLLKAADITAASTAIHTARSPAVTPTPPEPRGEFICPSPDPSSPAILPECISKEKSILETPQKQDHTPKLDTENLGTPNLETDNLGEKTTSDPDDDWVDAEAESDIYNESDIGNSHVPRWQQLYNIFLPTNTPRRHHSQESSNCDEDMTGEALIEPTSQVDREDSFESISMDDMEDLPHFDNVRMTLFSTKVRDGMNKGGTQQESTESNEEGEANFTILNTEVVAEEMTQTDADIPHHTQTKKTFSPTKRKQHPASDTLVLHFHGGGFVSSTTKSHSVYLRSWAQKLDCPIVSVDYSLAPQFPFPRALNECFVAYVWLRNNSKYVGWTGKRICVTGDSAGGNLAVAVALRCLLEGIRGPDGLVLSYPALSVSSSVSASRFLSLLDPLLPYGVLLGVMGAYIGDNADTDTSATDPLMSPVNASKDLLKRLPPMWIGAVLLDPLLDDSIHFAKLVRAAGGTVNLHVFPNLSHGFLNFGPLEPLAKTATNIVCSWIEESLKPNEVTPDTTPPKKLITRL